MSASTIHCIHSCSDHASNTLEADPLEDFRPVLQVANFDNLREHAVFLRRKRAPQIEIGDLTCEIGLDVTCGSYNIVFPLKFSDGVKWLIRIPHTGTPEKFEETAARNMIAEIRTLQLLRQRTSVPVPAVYDCDASCDNSFRVPYIIMEWIEGKKLCDIWADFSVGRAERMKRNSQTLTELADAVMQLNEFTFAQGGSPRFDTAGALLPEVGPALQEDISASVGTGVGEPVPRVYQLLGPSSTWEAFIFDAFKPWATNDPDDSEGTKIKVAKLFNSWIPQRHLHGMPFVLAHPDFDGQNIIVNDEGHVLAIIDWDHVRAVPRCLGNESYPNWLTVDMDHYTPREHVRQGVKTLEGRELSAKEMEQKPVQGPEGGLGWWVCTDSPEDLETYRTIWDQTIYDLAGDEARAVARGSLLLKNLYKAVREPMFFYSRFHEIQEQIQERMVAEGLIPYERIFIYEDQTTADKTSPHNDTSSVPSNNQNPYDDGTSVCTPEASHLASTPKAETLFNPHDKVDRGLGEPVKSRPKLGPRLWNKLCSNISKLVRCVVVLSRSILDVLACWKKTYTSGKAHHNRRSHLDADRVSGAASGKSPGDRMADMDSEIEEGEPVVVYVEDSDTSDSESEYSNDSEPEILPFFDPTFYEDAIREGILPNDDLQLLKRGFRLFVN